MKINENFPVRKIDIELSSEELDRYYKFCMTHDCIIQTLRSGPKIGTAKLDKNFRVVPGVFHIIALCDERLVDEMFDAIKK